MVKPHIQVAHAVAFAHRCGDDRVAVVERDHAIVVVVADGAGGMSGGALAAEQTIAMIREAVSDSSFAVKRHEAWANLLARIDLALEAHRDAGETTCVAVAIADDSLFGASAGDSGAWLVGVKGVVDLTAAQSKRRLGSGVARPAPIAQRALGGTLLVATDGLLARARRDAIAAIAHRADLDAGAEHLIRLVRSPRGALGDDVGVVLVRKTR